MRISVVIAVVGVLAVGALALLSTDDGSYVCERPPVVLVFSPMPERSQQHFFDEGTACNADARRRGVQVVVAAVVAGAAFGGARAWEGRHRERTGGEDALPSAG